VLLAIIDVFLSFKHLKSSHFFLICFTAILCGAGAVLDIFIPGGNYIWAFFTTAMLLVYFYIANEETTLDPLTGLQNNISFTANFNQLIKSNSNQSYIMTLFSLNDVKKIGLMQGQNAAQSLIKGFADLLRQATRYNDFIARIKDDMFIAAMNTKSNMEQFHIRFLNLLEEVNKQPDRLFIFSVDYCFKVFIPNENKTFDEYLQNLYETLEEKISNQKKNVS
jgi:GGDEF domain-containing protein